MTRAQAGDGKVIEVRLLDPRGTRFLADQYSVDEGGYVLDNPAVQGGGQGGYRPLTEGARVIIPHTNVQYAIESVNPAERDQVEA